MLRGKAMISEVDTIESGDDPVMTADTSARKERKWSMMRELWVRITHSLKRKIQHDCDSRKKLEEKLEQTRVQRQVEDYNFDDLE